MASISGKRRRKKKYLRSLLRSSNMRVTRIWTGKERPVMPWTFDINLRRPLRKRKRTPRVLRHH
ncbi:MAG: hypothetical protein ACTSWA_01480 [Candidatus Thorarchaeota archaeon]